MLEPVCGYLVPILSLREIKKRFEVVALALETKIELTTILHHYRLSMLTIAAIILITKIAIKIIAKGKKNVFSVKDNSTYNQ